MMKRLTQFGFIFMAVVAITYTWAVAGDSGPRVIDPFSESYKNNASAQVFSNATNSASSTRTTKVISTFEESQNQTNSSEAQANATVNLQNNTQEIPQQTSSGSQMDTTEKQPEQDYKVLKSK